jgi:hypothetical protein
MSLKIVVGISGGVTSAWCGGWALRAFPKDQVIFLNHDTKEEDPDTYRFIRDLSRVLDHPVTDYSDGRSVTEVCYDNNAIPNNRMAFCSRELKAEPGKRFLDSLKRDGHAVVKVLGFSGNEWKRIQRHTMMAEVGGYQVRFPVAETGITKQECADWCKSLGICLPAMYTWSDHANCPGCFRGGKAYWLAVAEHRPDVFAQRSALEKELGHTILPDVSLEDLLKTGLKRKVGRKEAIEIGPCECGD